MTAPERRTLPGYEAQHPWLERLFRPWTVALMMGCLAQAAAELLSLFYPMQANAYFVVTAMLGALIGYTVYRLGVATVPSEAERRSMQTLVLVAAFFVLKALSFLVAALTSVNVAARLGFGPLVNVLVEPWLFFVTWSAALQRVVASQLALWAVDPREFFDVTTLAGFAFFLISWGAAIATAKDFARIGEATADRRERLPLPAITQRFLTGGMLLLVFAGLARTELLDSVAPERPPVSGLIANVLLYTLLGFGMVGHTHLLTRIRRWQNERAIIAEDLARRWLRYGALFMLGATALAFVLPTGFTVPLLDWGRWLLWGLLLVGTLLFYLLMLLLWPLGWLLALLFRAAPPEMPALEVQPPPVMEAVAEGAAASAPQLLALRTLIVLALLLGGLVYLFHRYLQEHPDMRARLGELRPVLALRRWALSVSAWLRGLLHRTRARLREGFRDRRPVGEALASLRRALRLGPPETPRGQVLHSYLSTLETAEAMGVPRQVSQTPDEYEGTLAAQLPAAQAEVSALTEVFDEARYSCHPLTAADAERARRHAQAVAAALERRSGGAGEMG